MSLLLERLKKLQESKKPSVRVVPVVSVVQQQTPDRLTVLQKETKNSEETSFTREIPLNELQQKAVNMALDGISLIVTGPAGTGKTTFVQGFLYALVKSGNVDITTFRDPSGGIKEQEEKPSVACVGMTNRAVNNMRNSSYLHRPEIFNESLGFTPLKVGNYITCHKLLEYYPEVYTKTDPISGEQTETMHFIPNRDKYNKLDLQILIIEESSTLDIRFSNLLSEALQKGIQIIFLGDINQLPPVFGDSILNVALKVLPVINLIHVYRQALDSPIISNAHKVLKGELPISSVNSDCFRLITGKKSEPLGPETYGTRIINLIKQEYSIGKYTPKNTMILVPWNKQGSGSIRLNRLIAQFLDEEKKEEGKTPIYEIVAGFNKYYYAVGDKVYDGVHKEGGYITRITKNGLFYGTKPQEESIHLHRTGVLLKGEEGEDPFKIHENFQLNSNSYDYQNMNLDLEKETLKDIEERVTQASHSITIQYPNLDGEEDMISSASAINSLSLGYVLTTHKALGCEWENTYIIVHDSHFNVNREWLYTAITRAKVNCTLIIKENMLKKALARQYCKGNTLEEKIDSYNKKLDEKIAKGDKVYHPDLLDLIQD